MFELIFGLFILFIVLKVIFALGFGILRLILGLGAIILFLAIIPVSFALFLPIVIIGLVAAAFIALLKAILH